MEKPISKYEKLYNHVKVLSNFQYSLIDLYDIGPRRLELIVETQKELFRLDARAVDLGAEFSDYLAIHEKTGNYGVAYAAPGFLKNAVSLNWNIDDLILFYESSSKKSLVDFDDFQKFHDERIANDIEFKTRMVLAVLTDNELTY